MDQNNVPVVSIKVTRRAAVERTSSFQTFELAPTGSKTGNAQVPCRVPAVTYASDRMIPHSAEQGNLFFVVHSKVPLCMCSLNQTTTDSDWPRG